MLGESIKKIRSIFPGVEKIYGTRNRFPTSLGTLPKNRLQEANFESVVLFDISWVLCKYGVIRAQLDELNRFILLSAHFGTFPASFGRSNK